MVNGEDDTAFFLRTVWDSVCRVLLLQLLGAEEYHFFIWHTGPSTITTCAALAALIKLYCIVCSIHQYEPIILFPILAASSSPQDHANHISASSQK